jgi:uncharacterized protein with PIN domain
VTADERFGLGRHAAQLNFGDCSLRGREAGGRTLALPGGDFAKTDLQLA